MSTTKTCPRCGAEHAQRIPRCGCGYEWSTATRATTTVVADPMHGCCEFESSGDRCHYPGTFNTSTSGGGRWVCRAHSQENTPEMAYAIIQQSQRDIPAPDYSLKARKKASDKAFLHQIDAKYLGWAPEKYRANARAGILALAHKKPGEATTKARQAETA